MKITIYIDNSLTDNDSLDLFIKEFKSQLERGFSAGEVKSEFLNFNWKSE
jgi:hypothetical protein